MKADNEYNTSGRFKTKFTNEKSGARARIDLSTVLSPDPKELRIYNNDIVVSWELLREPKCYGKGSGNKKKIGQISRRSLRRLAFVAANTDTRFKVMITTTYPKIFPTDGRLAKKHLKAILQKVVRRFSCKHLWFMEFQKRGAVHFHIMTTQNGYDKHTDIDWLKDKWFDIVDSGDTRHRDAGTQIKAIRKADGAMRYVSKYASKQEQKMVPLFCSDFGRFFGWSRGVAPTCKRTIEVKGRNDMNEMLKDWDYIGNVKDSFVSVLYNAAKHAPKYGVQ